MEKKYVYAIRLFLQDGHMPMAELAFGDGGRPSGETAIIRWDIPAERELYVINAYTFVWDERLVPSAQTFNEFVHWQDAPNDEPAETTGGEVSEETFTIEDVHDAEHRINEIQSILENDFTMSRREELALVSERDNLEEKINQVKTEAMLPEALKSLATLTPEGGAEGYYYSELYADYQDCLSDRTIAEIIEKKDPAMAFEETLDEIWDDARYQKRDDIENDVKTYLGKNGIDYDYLEDAGAELIRDYIMDHVSVNIPEDHYLDQEVCVNIIIDSGDGNYDYILNALYPSSACNAVRPAQPGEEGYEEYDPETYISEKAGIAWLASTQGYTRGDLHRALMDDEIIPKEILKQLASFECEDPALTFLQSMRYEMLNCSSTTPCVTFMVRMTLRQLLILNQLINEQERNGQNHDATQNPDCGTITLRKDTWTILFDFISGAGSLFADIQMEKDCEIPIRFIRSATPNVNGCKNVSYSVKSVYDPVETAWKDTVTNIKVPAELQDRICLFGGKVEVIKTEAA